MAAGWSPVSPSALRPGNRATFLLRPTGGVSTVHTFTGALQHPRVQLRFALPALRRLQMDDFGAMVLQGHCSVVVAPGCSIAGGVM